MLILLSISHISSQGEPSRPSSLIEHVRHPPLSPLSSHSHPRPSFQSPTTTAADTLHNFETSKKNDQLGSTWETVLGTFIFNTFTTWEEVIQTTKANKEREHSRALESHLWCCERRTMFRILEGLCRSAALFISSRTFSGSLG
jgi:hypothetical protein